MATVINGTTGITTQTDTGDVSVGDDLIFTGTGNRITGDFSNATLANRVMFQTSTANGATQIAALPNGTNTSSNFSAHNASDPTNASRARIQVTSADASFLSDISGTGTYLPMTFYTGGSERVRIDTSGNVGIGTSSPVNKLSVSGGISSITNTNNANTPAAQFDYDGTGARWFAYKDTGSYQIFYTNASGGSVTERMRLDSSGRLLVGVTSWNGGTNNSGIQIKTTSTSSSAFAFTIDDSTAANIFNFRCDGSAYSKTGVWGTISDERLKENIVDATPKLNDLLSLQVRNFNFKSDEAKTKQIGFVAQEVETVFPGLVSEDEEGFKSVKTTVLVPMLVKAMQELKAELDSVKAELATLKGAA